MLPVGCEPGWTRRACSLDDMDSKDREGADACPGALSTHAAADGALARVRLPGGNLTPPQLQVLADSAKQLGDGTLELTSRGNVQLRAVSDPGQFATRLGAAGMLPSAAHERVRNIVASPLSGRLGGLADVRQLVIELDEELRRRPILAELPGRVLFALDDGRGDITGLAPDFGVQAIGENEFAVILAGSDSGARIDGGSVVDVLLSAAAAFRSMRNSGPDSGSVWRLAELDDGASRVLGALGLVAGPREPTPEPLEVPPIGWLTQDDGRIALGGALANGVLEVRLAEFLVAIDAPLIVTPWRSLVICDLDEGPAEEIVRVLAPMGLIFDASSPWIRVSSCIGSPGCSKSHADVRADLGAAVDARMTPRDERQHWSGCERRCGRPKGEITDVIATGIGYRVS